MRCAGRAEQRRSLSLLCLLVRVVFSRVVAVLTDAVALLSASESRARRQSHARAPRLAGRHCTAPALGRTDRSRNRVPCPLVCSSGIGDPSRAESAATMATLHNEEPQHGAGQETRVTKEDIERETRRLEQEVLASQQRSLATLGAAETVAAGTLEELAQQNEVIDGITVNLDAMENDLVYADMILKKIASPFAFMNMKTQGKAFETKFGKTADWSGPLGLKRSILPGFKKFYFVILEGRFMYFKGSGVKLSAASFDAARGTVALKCARIKTDKVKREIIVNSGSSKWHLQCSDDADFFGWSTMLQQFASGKRLERKRAKGLASVKEANASPVQESEPLPSSATAPSPVHSQSQSQSLFSAQQQLEQQQQQQLLQRQQHQQQQEEEQKAAQGKDANSFENIMDKNFDLMLQKMENLGAMALEQQNAINVQNGKLEQAHEAVQDRNASLTTLQRNHERRLK